MNFEEFTRKQLIQKDREIMRQYGQIQSLLAENKQLEKKITKLEQHNSKDIILG